MTRWGRDVRCGLMLKNTDGHELRSAMRDIFAELHPSKTRAFVPPVRMDEPIEGECKPMSEQERALWVRKARGIR